jgi:hypothetical protein
VDQLDDWKDLRIDFTLEAITKFPMLVIVRSMEATGPQVLQLAGAALS